ncbi:unnamed protein product [Sphacelaria rigidula]
MQKETRWGPEYNPDISKFFARGASKNPFYSDEVYDFLVGEKQGNRIYPYRLKSRDGNPRVLSDFRKNLKKSWVVESSPEDDEYVLLHKVQPGRRRDRLGKRKFTPGWRIVPHKKYVIPIIAQMHGQSHCGRDRALERLNAEYMIPNDAAKDVLARVKRRCKSCRSRTYTPKNPPVTTPITSVEVGREFNNKTVKDLWKAQGRRVLGSEPCRSRENGKNEPKEYEQLKNAHRAFTAEIGKLEGKTNSSVQMMKKGIVSAQAIGDHGMHSETRVSPHEAADCGRARAEMDHVHMTSLQPGEALTQPEVLAMNLDQAPVERASGLHAMSRDLKEGQMVAFEGLMEGRIVGLVFEDGKPEPSSVRVEITVDANKVWGLQPEQVKLPSPTDPEISELSQMYGADKDVGLEVCEDKKKREAPAEAKYDTRPLRTSGVLKGAILVRSYNAREDDRHSEVAQSMLREAPTLSDNSHVAGSAPRRRGTFIQGARVIRSFIPFQLRASSSSAEKPRMNNATTDVRQVQEIPVTRKRKLLKSTHDGQQSDIANKTRRTAANDSRAGRYAIKERRSSDTGKTPHISHPF